MKTTTTTLFKDGTYTYRLTILDYGVVTLERIVNGISCGIMPYFDILSIGNYK